MKRFSTQNLYGIGRYSREIQQGDTVSGVPCLIEEVSTVLES